MSGVRWVVNGILILWKEVKAQKDYQCRCCGGSILKGDRHFVMLEWVGMYLQPTRFCFPCGYWIRFFGYSFRQAREKAFGSPLLRGWVYPK